MDVGTEEITAGDAVADVLKSHLSADDWQWLLAAVQQIASDAQATSVARIFTSLPRYIRSGNTHTSISLDQECQGPNQLPLVVDNWPVVRLARVWMLMIIPRLIQEDYVQLIERLFKYGDMEELIALYTALPAYHYPAAWQSRCKEGIRSNIEPVRHAVMVHNPYPSRFLDEAAWNQLVLKAFFTDEDIPNIMGLSERNNPRLAQALTDYAYERYAAKRDINPMLWILVGPFMEERAYDLMERILNESTAPLERQAIAYAFKHNSFGRALEYAAVNDGIIALSDANGTPWEMWEQ